MNKQPPSQPSHPPHLPPSSDRSTSNKRPPSAKPSDVKRVEGTPSPASPSSASLSSSPASSSASSAKGHPSNPPASPPIGVEPPPSSNKPLTEATPSPRSAEARPSSKAPLESEAPTGDAAPSETPPPHLLLPSDIQTLLQSAALWDVRSEKERDLLKVVVSQYGLDPLTREVIFLDGNVYVTASGVQRLAVRDPFYDGCEIEIVQADWVKNFFVVKARVWKKQCEHPFEDYGDADPSTSRMRGHALFRHAITRARSRAMRSAFAIPFCTLEELDDETRAQMMARRRDRSGGAETTASSASASPVDRGMAFLKAAAKDDGHPPLSSEGQEAPASEAQLQAIRRTQNELGLSEESLASEFLPSLHLASLDQINRVQASRLLDLLDSRLSQQPAGHLPAHPEAQMLCAALEKASSLQELRTIWGKVQSLRSQFPEAWVQRLCDVKDQRKQALERPNDLA